MCVNETGGKMLERVEVVKVAEFKYLETTIQSNGRCTRETGWSG